MEHDERRGDEPENGSGDGAQRDGAQRDGAQRDGGQRDGGSGDSGATAPSGDGRRSDASLERWLDELMGLGPDERAERIERDTQFTASISEASFEAFLQALEEGDTSGARARLSTILRYALDGDPSPPPTDMVRRLDELRRLGPEDERFVRGRRIGRGGMGVVHAVHDRCLRRDLALKGLRPDRDRGGRPDPALVRRFVDEAQVTAQLEHPGIVPVHDIGVDAQGRPFFAMQLVHGVTFTSVIEALHREPDAVGGRWAGGVRWTRERAVETLLRASEAVAFAHSRSVVHRDLKPDNVMVGEFGAVYVMDWGLAQVAGNADVDPLPVERRASAAGIVTDGRARTESSAHGLSTTQDGAVLGTLHYMAPEQASGRRDEVGPHSDGYALGALLYHLLAGYAPFDEPGQDEGRTVLTTLTRVATARPLSIDVAAPNAPAELRSICRRAMAPLPEDRYEDVTALSEDLRAYLEGRVVRAHRTGVVVSMAKWIERNRALSGSVAAGLLVAGATLTGLFLSVAEAAELERESALAAASRDGYRSLVKLDRLEREAAAQRAIDPDLADAYRAWLREADALVADEEQRGGADPAAGSGFAAATADEAGAVALPAPDPVARAHAARRDEVRRIERTVAFLRSAGAPPETLAFLTEAAASLRADVFAPADGEQPRGGAGARSIERRLAALAGAIPGPRSGVTPAFGVGVEDRLALIEGAAAWQASPAARAAWSRALDVARDPEGPYGGLELARHPLLAPLDVDPASGLLEFAHLATGAVPQRGADGRLPIAVDDAVVLVLVPGGTYWVGAERAPGAARSCDLARDDEGPCHVVHLDPFLLGKHELTQAQWLRLAGANPSAYPFDPAPPDGSQPWLTPLNPVENMRWSEAVEVLATVGLELPTESQHEAAASAGSRQRWATGDDPASLSGAANIVDAVAATYPGAPKQFADYVARNPDHVDPFVLHAPVGSFAANRFGLHDLAGNVYEWCADSFAAYDGSGSPDAPPVWHGRGERAFLGYPATEPDAVHVARGGAFSSSHDECRVTFRNRFAPGTTSYNIGIRPSMRAPLADAN